MLRWCSLLVGLIAAASYKEVAGGALSARSLQSTSQKTVFEVAAIKPSKDTSVGGTWRIERGGRFIASAMPVQTLILLAYGIRSHELVGAPTWLTSDRFDIVANATGELINNTVSH